jgi:hypothetical protein
MAARAGRAEETASPAANSEAETILARRMTHPVGYATTPLLQKSGARDWFNQERNNPEPGQR